MVSSVRWWHLEEEEQDFADYLQSNDEIVAMEQEPRPRLEEVAWHPVNEVIPTKKKVLLTLESLTPLCPVEYRETFPREGYSVSHVESPVILYRAAQMTEYGLDHACLSANKNYLGPDNKLITHPEAFLRWSKRVLQWARRFAPDWYEFKQHRITKKADEARLAGLSLV